MREHLMKALILAGGRGTRLRPLTHTKNKQLLPIANQPMISRILEDAIAIGINDIIINVNKGDTELPSVIGDGSSYGIKISYIEQPEPNGMMYPIRLAQKLIGNDTFLFSAGDNILVGGLQKHYDDFIKNKSDAHVLVVKRPDYQQFGVAVLDGNKVINTVEKPKEFVSDLVLTAIYFFTPAVFESFDYIKPIDPKGTGKPEYFPPVVINWMVKQGYTFTASEITGWWKDTGLPEDLIAANAFVLENKDTFSQEGTVIDSKVTKDVEIQSGSIINTSSLSGPISIGHNVQIDDSDIGQSTSIGDNSIIKNARIENSIIMDGVVIEDCTKTIKDSIIGSGTQITACKKSRRSLSFYIGDDAVLNI